RLFKKAAAVALSHRLKYAKNHRRAGGSISKCPSLHMTKETVKALAVIIISLGVLVVLLLWANHLRPHP
ncbi:MAG: hypothetical protein DMF04_09150, partial [Verrucomicrobia bacterium]